MDLSENNNNNPNENTLVNSNSRNNLFESQRFLEKENDFISNGGKIYILYVILILKRIRIFNGFLNGNNENDG